MSFIDARIDLPRVRLAYTASLRANAPTVVLAHSLFFDKSLFRDFAMLLAEEYSVIAYDARAHGDSGAPTDDRYDVDAFYDDAVALIEALNVGPVHFVGNSMGGFAAVRLAARRPDLVQSAAALGSSADAEGNIDSFSGIVQHLRANGGSGMEDTLTHVFFGDDSLESAAFASLREYWRGRFKEMPPSVAAPAAGVVYRSAVLPELRRCERPVLALAGAQDRVYPVALSEAIARTAPRGTCKVIAGAGHSVAMEQPMAAHAALKSWLDLVS
jgi:3-oxoadipate enol-lactonase